MLGHILHKSYRSDVSSVEFVLIAENMKGGIV